MSYARYRAPLGICLWAVGTCLAFWIFDARYLRPVARPAGATTVVPGVQTAVPFPSLSTDQGTVVLNAPKRLTLLNFWNPDCACSRFAEDHVRALIHTYQPRGVDFVTVIQSGPGEADQIASRAAWNARHFDSMPIVMDTDGEIARRFGVWAAPAAVVVDRSGHIVYLGAYNASRFCANPDSAWVHVALEDLLAGRTPRHASTPFYGCQILNRK